MSYEKKIGRFQPTQQKIIEETRKLTFQNCESKYRINDRNCKITGGFF
jgi:hypothetical protein